MHHPVRLAAAPVLALAVSCALPAWADEDDADVVGPTGRNSVALSVGRSAIDADLVTTATGAAAGRVDGSRRELNLLGVWSVNPRFSLTGGLLAQSDKTSVQVGGLDSRDDSDGLGYLLLASWRPVGTLADNGYKLVVNGGVRKDEGEDPLWHLAVQPQVRVSAALLLAGSLIAEHQQDSGNRQGVRLHALWRMAPAWSLVPSVTVLRQDAHDDLSSFTLRRVELGTTYRLDNRWSVNASVARLTQGDAVSTGTGLSVTGYRSTQFMLGARYGF